MCVISIAAVKAVAKSGLAGIEQLQQGPKKSTYDLNQSKDFFCLNNFFYEKLKAAKNLQYKKIS